MIIKSYLICDQNLDYFKINPSNQKREWMSDHAYKCLPLNIANQFGWTVNCPVSFKATWNGNAYYKNSFMISYENENNPFNKYVYSNFGDGILTFDLPFVFKTEKSYGLFVRGPTNHVKYNITYLDAFIETDWINYGFTYNIKFQRPYIEVEFKKGEPLFSFFPFNLSSFEDIKIETMPLETNPELQKKYREYGSLRTEFHKNMKTEGEWMKDYLKGDQAERKSIGCPFLNSIGKYIHFTNLKLHDPNKKN